MPISNHESLSDDRVIVDAMRAQDEAGGATLLTTRQARCVHGIPGLVICRARREVTTWRGLKFRVVD